MYLSNAIEITISWKVYHFFEEFSKDIYKEVLQCSSKIYSVEKKMRMQTSINLS